jgi:hypothetical protein
MGREGGVRVCDHDSGENKKAMLRNDGGMAWVTEKNFAPCGGITRFKFKGFIPGGMSQPA